MELCWEEVVENNAWTTKQGWRPCPISSSDPARFTNRDYTKFRHPKDIPLPTSDTSYEWVWAGDWIYTRWKFCKKWDRNESAWSYGKGKRARCKQRIWKRPRVRNNDENGQQSVNETVYENQRHLVKRWASPFLPNDRPHWSDVNGIFKTQGMINNKLPLDWKWLNEEWQIEITETETDDDGWQYAPDFNAVNWSSKRTILHHVRRRKWTRTRMRSNKQKSIQMRKIRTVSDVSKLKATIKSANEDGFDGQLVVSYTNQFVLSWSTHGVIESSGYQCSVWQPKLGKNEYCLGYLLSGEKTYPNKSFLLIIKKTEECDDDAIRRPNGLTLIWRTSFNDASATQIGYFYKPKPPPGYVALGDVCITKKKGVAVTVDDFPKLVCIKKEFVDQFAEIFDDDATYSKKVRSKVQPHTMIWNTKKLQTKIHCQLWTQPPFSNEVESPLFVCTKLEKPSNVYPRLNIRHVLQDDPDNITVYSSWMTKKGKGVGSQSKKRFFILTSQKQLFYYENDECRILKGTVDLTKMTDKCRVNGTNSEKFEIPTSDRLWSFTCNSSQDSIKWVNEINKVWRDPKAVINKIIAAQIQGQPQDEDEDEYKNDDESDKDSVKQLFDAPKHAQVARLLGININIIKKILKDDHEKIKSSVLDQVFKQQQMSPKVEKKSSNSFNLKKKISNSMDLLQQQVSSSQSGINIIQPNGAEDLMSTHNENKESIYKYFDDAWKVVRLLLKFFEDDKIEKPAQIDKFIGLIPELEKQSIDYIMDKITNYVSKYGTQPDPFEIIKMCDACALVESFQNGQIEIVKHVTDILMQQIKVKYVAKSEFAGCEYVNLRFEDYRKQIALYDGVYGYFIPAKWMIPVTFSLQFCKLTGDQIDEQLKLKPEKPKFVNDAKRICMENEDILQKEARTFLAQHFKDADEIKQNLPNYDGLISSILDQHLNSYINDERSKAKECVLSAKNETFSVLSSDGSLIAMYEAGATKESSQKHRSCEQLLLSIRQGFKKCISISRGQQLVDLLAAHQIYLGQYYDILLDQTREALETNNVIFISSSIRKKNEQNIDKLTERYLWFEGYYATNDGTVEPIKRRDRNKEDTVIQTVLTFLVLTFNSALYCKESMLNLGKASHKALENNLKKEIDFRELHTKFESLQYSISESLSQAICCRIVQDVSATYRSMDFAKMTERNYVNLEKCAYLVEGAWSNLAIQLLYIMPKQHFAFMIKRCVYLLAEYLYESTLRLRNVTNKIAKKLNDSYVYVKGALIEHLKMESQYLASEIGDASNIIFAPTDALFDLLCTDNEPISAFEEDDRRHRKETDIFESIKTTFGMNEVTNVHDAEPQFFRKYTAFEMKVVDFYHSSNVVLCFQTLLLQLIESQIKLNRSAKTSVKPIFFHAFNFAAYKKPQKDEKLILKERLICKIMDCKGINEENQKKIKDLYKEKTPVDMKTEQQNSISDAIIKKQEWEKEQREKRMSSSADKDIEPSEEEKDTKVPEYSQKSASQSVSQSVSKSQDKNEDEVEQTKPQEEEDEDIDVIVMTQKIDVKDVDNKLVVAVEPKIEFKKVTDEDDKKEEIAQTNIVKKKPPSYRPPPPKVPNLPPPKIPSTISKAPPKIPSMRPPPKPKSEQPKGLLGGLLG